jgi:hypothetical protein
VYDIMTSCRRAVKYERSFVIRVLQLFWCSEVSTNLLMMVINSFFFRDSSRFQATSGSHSKIEIIF